MKERLKVGELRDALFDWTERLALPDLNARVGKD